MKTLIEILTAKKQSVVPSFFFYASSRLVGDVSYKDIYDISLEKAAKIQKLKGNSPVLIEGNNDLEFVTNFFAVQMAGRIPVPVTTHLWITEDYYTSIMESILKVTKADLFLGSHKAQSLLKTSRLKTIYPTEWEKLETSKDFKIASLNENDTAFLQFSSGSTGNPKGVILTHKNVLSNLDQIQSGFPENKEESRCVSWLPVHHDMGLIGGFLFPFSRHFDCHMMTPYDFAVNPARWLRLISEQKANMIVAPNSGYHLTTKRIKNPEKFDLSGVRVALCGAEPVNLNTMKAFTEKFAISGFNPESITPCYGMAENTLAISFANGSELKVEYLNQNELYENNLAAPLYGESIDRESSIAYVSCGKPLAGVEVMIIDDKNYELEERHVGEIIIKSPSTCKGYYDRDDLNAELFIDGYLKTGDLGYIANGELFITGRKKDVIILNGLNINAEEIESQLLHNPLVRPGRLVALATSTENNDSEEISLILETKPSLKYLNSQLRDFMQDSVFDTINSFVNVKKENIHIVPPGTIQKTTSGKVKRNKMKELLVNNNLSQLDFSQEFFQYKLKENSIKASLLIDTVRISVKNKVSGLIFGR